MWHRQAVDLCAKEFAVKAVALLVREVHLAIELGKLHTQ